MGLVEGLLKEGCVVCLLQAGGLGVSDDGVDGLLEDPVDGLTRDGGVEGPLFEGRTGGLLLTSGGTPEKGGVVGLILEGLPVGLPTDGRADGNGEGLGEGLLLRLRLAALISEEREILGEGARGDGISA